MKPRGRWPRSYRPSLAAGVDAVLRLEHEVAGHGLRVGTGAARNCRDGLTGLDFDEIWEHLEFLELP